MPLPLPEETLVPSGILPDRSLGARLSLERGALPYYPIIALPDRVG